MLIVYWPENAHRQPVKIFLDDLDEEIREHILDRFDRYVHFSQQELSRSKEFLPVQGLYELRICFKRQKYRFYCVIRNETCVLLLAVNKKWDKARPDHIKLAKQRAKTI